MFMPMFPTQLNMLAIPGLEFLTPENVASFCATLFAFYMAARRGLAAAGTLSNVPPPPPVLPPPPQLTQILAAQEQIIARIERIEDRLNNLDRRADRIREDVNRLEHRWQRLDLQMRTSQEFEMDDTDESDNDANGIA